MTLSIPHTYTYYTLGNYWQSTLSFTYPRLELLDSHTQQISYKLWIFFEIRNLKSNNTCFALQVTIHFVNKSTIELISDIHTRFINEIEHFFSSIHPFMHYITYFWKLSTLHLTLTSTKFVHRCVSWPILKRVKTSTKFVNSCIS